MSQKPMNRHQSQGKSGVLAFWIYITLLVLLAAATMVEKLFGSEVAYQTVYGAWWTVVLWGALVVSSLFYFIQSRLYRKPLVFVFHLSFLCILLGAAITYLDGERGYAHIRQGETVNYYLLEGDAAKQHLPFAIKLVLFDIAYHPGTDEPADYISYLKVDDEMCAIAMNKIHKHKGYRLYQMDYDEDEMGTVLMVSHDPWGIGVTYFGYILLGLSMLALLFRRLRLKLLLPLLLSVAAVWFYISQLNPMTPILRSPMLAAHVSVIMVSYLLLLLIALQSVVGLCSAKWNRKLYQRNRLLLYPALFFLAAGIFIGAVWANISWGRYWGWDAKETWALITLMVYAFPFHRKSIPAFRKEKTFHLFCAVAFLCILMTFFGVSFFLGGIHAYL